MEENTLKTKQEILTALAHSGDDKLLLAGLLDKEQTCEQRGYLTHTKFLDLKQRALCTDAVRLAGATGHALFWGGYEDAERGIYLFYPDYMDAESAKLSAPLALLRARKRREDTLTHRDYLGSLMGLQIDRSVVGDILGARGRQQTSRARGYGWSSSSCTSPKQGRKQLSLTREDLSDLKHAAVEEKRGTGSVASPRLDSVAALIFGLPRQGRTGADRERTGVRQQHTLHEAGAPDYGRRPPDRARRRPCARGSVRAGTSRKGRIFLEYVRNA